MLTPRGKRRIRDHFEWRRDSRAIPDEHLAAALAGRAIPQEWGRVAYYDRTTRTLLVWDTDADGPVTAFRLRKRHLKARYSR